MHNEKTRASRCGGCYKERVDLIGREGKGGRNRETHAATVLLTQQLLPPMAMSLSQLTGLVSSANLSHSVKKATTSSVVVILIPRIPIVDG